MSLEPEQRAEINVALQPMVTGNSSWLVSVVEKVRLHHIVAIVPCLQEYVVPLALREPGVVNSDGRKVRALAIDEERTLVERHGVRPASVVRVMDVAGRCDGIA